METATIAIIGGGNMGTSLVGGLINNQYPAEKIWVSGPTATKLNPIKKQFNVNITVSNAEAVQQADVVIFAVKAQVLTMIAKDLKEIIQSKKPLVMSVAAGLREKNLQYLLGGSVAIVRVMPNTPSLIGCGASALYANTYATTEQKNLAECIMRSLGIIVWLEEEKLLDAVTALSGCGPAYYFLVTEILQQAGVAMGLSKDVARLLVLQTALGAARMAMESQESVLQLRQQVTSPGGATEHAIKVLEKENIRKIFSQALIAAKNRTEEIAKLWEENPHDNQ